MREKKAARKLRRDVTMTERLCEAIRSNLPIRLALSQANVKDSTYHEYMSQGERDIADGKTTEFTEFAASIKKAFSDAALAGVKVIEQAGKKQWQAQAWLLERVHRKEFSINGDFQEKFDERLNKLEHLLTRMATPPALLDTTMDRLEELESQFKIATTSDTAFEEPEKVE